MKCVHHQSPKDIFDQVLQLPEDEQRALQELLNQQHPTTTHWGQQVIAAIQALSPEMQNDPAYDDPVAWLKQQRES